jgi:LDH2 family malate/lactate/ureidoglycolate dehydrogenase
MVTKPAEELRQLTRQILEAAGAASSQAEIVADHLVLANLRGVDSHGVWHVPGYVKAIRAGHIKVAAEPKIIKQTPVSALVSGDWAFGHVVARFGMQTAIEKAAEHGLAVVSVVQIHHIGRLGHYPEMAAAEGMVSMVWAGGQGAETPAAVPYGGRKALFHTNPIAMGLPTGSSPPVIIDFATSAIAGVKVVNAYNRHQELPADCVVDKDGKPTTDPRKFMDGGAHLPFGGHKGYGLMLATEFLGRIFSGADDGAQRDYSDPLFRRHGATLIVFRANLFQPLSEYSRRADEMAQRTRAVPPAPGFKEVLLPGMPEDRAQNARQRDGIPIADDVWKSILDAAASVGIQA